MLRTVKPRSARTKRILEQKVPKINEGPKSALFIKSTTCSQNVLEIMKELYRLKKPDAVLFSRSNELRPFEDYSSIEFYSKKTDASHIVVGSHSKKRPNNLTFCRMFSHDVYDLLEVGVDKFLPMIYFKTENIALGLKPLLVFKGTEFESNEKLKLLKSVLIDFFNYGFQENSQIDPAGLQYVIYVTAKEFDISLRDVNSAPEVLVKLRGYYIKLRKSGSKLPNVHLVPMGPFLDLKIRRTQEARQDIEKSAYATPQTKRSAAKNHRSIDILGNQTARIHLGQQNIHKQQTRKFKGLKRSRDDNERTNV